LEKTELRKKLNQVSIREKTELRERVEDGIYCGKDKIK
jgi:hypothetical protein